jgi:dTDP-4-amino-4,6-dideoxygalactose transaminase
MMPSLVRPRPTPTATGNIATAGEPIPLNDLKRQYDILGDEIDGMIRQVVAAGRYVLGSHVAGFEAAFAGYCGVGHCVGLGNGTDALELALRVVGCGAGDEVINVPNAGMYATGAILAVGARPVLVDIDPQRMTMAPASLEKALGPATKAVVVTHLYGRLADMDAVAAVLRGRDVAVIEDCAQAHGAERGGRKAGSFGALGCFSFYPTKNLGALGDGGAIVTSDSRLAEALRELRQYGWQTKYYAVRPGGRNSRLDEIQAAALRLKLPHLDRWNARRREIAGRYREVLGKVAALPAPATDDVAHLCVVRTKLRLALQEHLARDGIATDIHYPVPDHRQLALRDVFSYDLSLPQAEAAAEEVLTLPCFPELTEDEIGRVCDSLARFSQRESVR